MYHPWRSLPDDVTVEYASLPPPLRGKSDGGTRIVLHDRLLQVERRCTLEHEKVHLERGDAGKCRPAEEGHIDREVARRLIPHRSLVDAMVWSSVLEEVADELWVTPKIARARIDTLRPADIVAIATLIADTRS